MHVCHLINDLSPGGAAQLILNLVRQTPESDAVFTICCIEQDDALADDLQAAGARVVTFEAAHEGDVPALWQIARFIRKGKFDVLHTHLPYAATLGRLVAQSLDNDTMSVMSTQHNMPNTYHPVTKLSEKLTRRLDDTTIAVSGVAERAFTGTDEAHYYPKRNGRWTTIHNGIDMARFSGGQGSHIGTDMKPDATTDGDTVSVRERWGINANTFLFLNVGRLVPSKCPEALICAMARVLEEYPNAMLLLVGWGPLKERLTHLIKSMSLEEHVILAGREKIVEPYYQAADSFVFASHSEGFGIVLAEAMAAKLPIVASDIPTTCEVLGVDDADDVVNGTNGSFSVGQLVASEGEDGRTGRGPTAEAMAAGMIAIADLSPSERRERGRAGHERAVKCFSATIMAQKYIDLYQSVVTE